MTLSMSPIVEQRFWSVHNDVQNCRQENGISHSLSGNWIDLQTNGFIKMDSGLAIVGGVGRDNHGD